MRSSADTTDRDGPNVVFLHCHDLGRHLGCYGERVETPRIDALAEDSIRFTNYFAAAPTCSPSRGSLMTGRYPHRNGLMGLQHRGWELNECETTLPEALRRAGYDTHLFGVQHVAADPRDVGYDHAVDESTRAHDVVDTFAGMLDGRSSDSPFFASLGFHEPHTPFRRADVSEDAYEQYDPDSMAIPSFLPDDPDVRERLAEYQGLITGAVDPAVGRVVDLLDDFGLVDQTLLVVTTDHGIPFERAKATCFDAGLACALLVRPPEGMGEKTVSNGGETRDELLSGVDLLPTILDLVGVDVPDWDVDGRSFAPLVTGEGETDYTPRERIYAEQTWHARPSPTRAIRTREYKFVMNAMTLVPHAGKSAAHPEGRTAPDEELYDLRADPDERENLASDLTMYDGPPNQSHEKWLASASDPHPDHTEALQRLRADLLDWLAATDDPLADGCLPLSTRERRRWHADADDDPDPV